PGGLGVPTGGPGVGPFATHRPVFCAPGAPVDPTGDLRGTTLLGHMNKANPHWKALETGSVLLLTFTGPHSYVSPTVYRKTPAAPTWNFTAVHVRGVVRMLGSAEETLSVVESTVRAFEKDFGDGWDMTESLDYFRKIVPAAGAFGVTVTGVEGMFKLSQEQPGEVRERVRESFGQSACTYKRETAGLMGRL
ncbi:FMN-binding negative transcriptional regulator, partial [Streptomyces sp. NPDC058861]|uniref:FMN-binding negative transcriptional regulator n=1 Tax=Streptomyces sp. NPDC058861 TaxID=3346653 RepID=UPI0036A98809